MNKSIKFLAIAAVLGFAGSAFAQNTSSISATATVDVVHPILITTDRALNFGNVIQGVGSVQILPDNSSAPVYTGNVNPGTQTGSPSSAHFHVTGEPGYLINTTGSDATVTVDGVVVTLVRPGGSPYTLTGGAFDYYVGGTFTVAAATPLGTFTSHWNEKVNYN